MKKYSWLFVILGVVVLGFALLFSAALGAGAAYFFLQADPVQAAFAAPADLANDQGVLISAVDPESPAAEAGLVRGDIVLDVNGVAVNNLLDLQNVLNGITPGELAELTVLHGDETRSLTVELGDRDGLAYLGVSTCGAPMRGAKMFTDPSGDAFIKDLGFSAEVTEVIAGSPAEEAGLLVGDQIISVDGEKISFHAGLADLIQSHEPGDTVTLEVRSAETDETQETHEVEVTLGEHPDLPNQAYLGVGYQMGFPQNGMPHFFQQNGEEFQGQLPEDWDQNAPFFFHGMPEKGTEGLPFDLPQLPEGIDGAVVVSEVITDTPAAEAGLQPNDLIVAVDSDPVKDIETFVEMMQSHKPGDSLTLTIFRGGEELEVNVTLTEHPDNPEKGFLGIMAGTLILEFPEEFDQNFELELPGVPGGDA